jgi:L-histidine Nalpha-methyltransferase
MSEVALSEPLRGLYVEQKHLPMWMLYDEAGCLLYEQITTLPEYYLTRTEAQIFTANADNIWTLCSQGGRAAVAEIGAGTATKTEIVLAAALRAQQTCTLLVCDIAPEPLAIAKTRIEAALPKVSVRTFTGTHVDAGPAIAALEDRQILLFLGSSIGNYSDAAAVELLCTMRKHLRDDGVLVLGTDLRKDPVVLRAAYDDAQGVTARFTKNVLTRLNREYDCTFDVDHFAHIAEWSEARSDLDLGLRALVAHEVQVGNHQRIAFKKGEMIHIETCAKYDEARVDKILGASGFARVKTFYDDKHMFGVQVAKCVAR